MMQTLRTLIVDDEPLAREHAGMVSATLGYRPTVAATAEEALALLRSETFDLLFTNVRLSGPLDALARAEAAALAQPSISVVFASGRPDGIVPDRDDGLRGGTILRKPYDVDALARALEAALLTRRTT